MANDMIPKVDKERLAALTLATSPNYRVLQRLQPRRHYGDGSGQKLFRGLVVDTEATGLDANEDLIIELAMVPFTYTAEGEVIEVLEEEIYTGLQDPGRPLPPEITEVTGLTDADLAGQHLDAARVETLVRRTDLTIAHNADYDRRMLERFCPAFKDKVVACSQKQIPWRSEKIGSAKQEYIAMCQGLFYDAHRALEDARALLHLLAMPLPVSNRWPLTVMREALAAPLYSIHAVDTPYAAKQDLYRLGFRWREERPGRAKGYRKLVSADVVEAEVAQLLELLERYSCRSSPQVTEVAVRDRFSDRE